MAVDQSESLLTLHNAAIAIFTYIFVATIYNFLTFPQPPTSIPWLGYGKGWFASVRNFTALSKSKEWLTRGYEQYSKNDRVFVLPSTLGMQAEMVMPPSQLAWMFDQPDNVLSTSEAHYDFLRGDYCFVDPIILKRPYHEHVVHKHLVKSLNSILPELEDEVPFVVDQIYGTDTKNYKKIDCLESFMRMVPGLTNRMIIGKSVARERKFLDAVLSFTMDVIRVQSFLVLVPTVLHPIFGPILSLAAKYHYWQSSKWSLPVIKQRIADFKKKDAGDPQYRDWKEPSDFVTWSYRTAQSEGILDEMTPKRIAQRIMPINFASIHTTSLTAYEVLNQVLSSDPSIVASLREEAHRVLKEEGGWTKQALTRMHRLDSAVRESQRFAPIALTFIARKVVAKAGITTPEGVHVKFGTMLSCPWQPLAGDAEFHDGPDVFDAFRFSRPREEYEVMSTEEKTKVDALKLKQTGMVTTRTHHLAFGHGRHACPGRFFVSHELKMIFAYLLLNYDFKPLAKPAPNMWVVRYRIPGTCTIEAKRREAMWTPEAEPVPSGKLHGDAYGSVKL